MPGTTRVRRVWRRVIVTAGCVAMMAGAASVPAIAVPIEDGTVPSTQGSDNAAPLNLAVSPTRLELISTGDAAANPRTISIRAAGGSVGTIVVEFRDAVIDDRGGWRLVPVGSTPNGLQDALRITPMSFPYDPAAGTRDFRPAVTLVPSALDRPRFGALIVTFTPGDAPGGQLVVQGAVAIQVVAARRAAQIDAAARAASSASLRLDLDGLAVRQDDPWTVVSGILPRFPRLIGHGPGTIRVHGTNTGDTVLDSRVTYRIYRRNPLAVLPFVASNDTPTLVIRQRPRFLLGGQEFTDEVSTRQQPKGAAASDALPFIGLVRVEATLTGSIAGLRAAPVTRSHTFVVLPWAEILLGIMAFVAWRRWRDHRRRQRNAARRGTRVDRPPGSRSRRQHTGARARQSPPDSAS